MSLWARGHGIVLVEADQAALNDPGIQRALLDGIDRGLDAADDADLLPPGATPYAIRERGTTVGLLLVARGRPALGDATLLAVAVAPAHRGRAFGTKALLLAEQTLLRDGHRRMLARVPRTNGRGFYFMLRCGMTPLPAEERNAVGETGDATWFHRRTTPATGTHAARVPHRSG